MNPVLNSGLGRASVKAAKLMGSLGAMFVRHRIEGFVDQVRAGEIIGWACDPGRPDRRVLIVALAEGKVIAETLADLPRKDLVNLGKGDGRHGFRLRIPGDMSETASRSIRVEAVCHPRNVLLQRGKIEFVPRQEAVESEAAPSGLDVQAGFLERWSGAEISGWACDPANPAAAVQVDVFDGERFLGSVPCDQERPRLQASGAPPGARGFVYQLADPAALGNGHGLRVRIAGSRIDLRRSKSFPGAAKSADLDLADPITAFDLVDSNPADNLIDPALLVAAPPVAPRPAVSGTAFLICGEGSEAMVESTLASCRTQTWPEVEVMRIAPGTTDDQRHGLTALLASRSTVVFLNPGQTLDPDLARVINQSRKPFDVCTWPVDATPNWVEPDIAALLGGGFTGALAVRSAVLKQFEGDLAATLTRGELGALAGWAARSGLRWTSLAGRLSTPALVRSRERVLPPVSVPRRVSLAIWTGWETPESTGLRSLLAGCADLQIEVLAPDGVTEEDLRALAPATLSSLSIKRIDLPQTGGDSARWRALTQAATGQVVVLCHGDVRLSRPEALPQICAWSMTPGVGAVTLPIVAQNSPAMAGLGLVRDPSGLKVVRSLENPADAGSRPVLAAPAAFMVISRESLVAVGGFDGERLPDGLADLDLALRLRRQGRSSVVLDSSDAVTDEARLASWSSQAVPAAAEAVLGGDIDGVLRPTPEIAPGP